MESKSLCDHCQEPIFNKVTLDREGETKEFCCHGCRTVYSILKANGLTNYYSLKADSKTSTPLYSDKTYSYLDSEEFKKQYLISKDGELNFVFFVEGVHCVACLWLLEKLNSLHSKIISSRLDMSKSLLSLSLKEDIKLSEVAKLLDQLGYRPFAVLEEDDQKVFQKMENRKDLIRIGVAFACTGNIMLYALSVYTGASDFYKTYFNLFGFLCFLPILFYCSIPFYKSAYSSLKAKSLSVDIPIVVAISLSFIMGIYSFIFDKEYFYFDTMSSLVFLLLLSRYLLKKLQQKSLGSENLQSLYMNHSARKILNDGSDTEVLSKYLRKGDRVKVLENEEIPIDGTVIKGESYLNNSLLTGEVKPVKVKKGDQVFMGAKNLSKEILIDVNSEINSSRFGKMLGAIEKGWNTETQFSILTDKISSKFVLFVFSLATIFFVYFLMVSNLETAISRSLTLLIITCPCALALTTPLAFILGLTNFAKYGYFIKDEKTIEKLTHIKSVFFDKTGTLTYGDFKIILFERNAEDEVNIQILYHLEKFSQHPIAQSITQYIETHFSIDQNLELTEVTETPGVGVKAQFQGKNYHIGRLNDLDSNYLDSSQVGLYCEGRLLIKIILSDSIREEVHSVLSFLRQKNIKTYILSGDHKSSVENIGLKLGFSPDEILSEMSPEDKSQVIARAQDCLMIGDGANDALAMQKAFIGVSVRGAAELSLRASDIYLSKNGVEKLTPLVQGALRIINLIKRNLAFSFLYNVLGIYLAFTGEVTPLVAAILMPLSSITVMLSTLAAIKKLNKVII